MGVLPFLRRPTQSQKLQDLSCYQLSEQNGHQGTAALPAGNARVAFEEVVLTSVGMS